MSTPLRPCIKHVNSTKRVTFANTDTSILIPTELNVSPQKARERTRALASRKATPHKKTRGVSYQSQSPSVAASGKKKPRLIESGAIRVQIATHTNPRRAVMAGGSQRLIDQGAVRLNITRHTTPRRLYATRSRIWSPPPPTSSRKLEVPQSERLHNRHADNASAVSTATPTKQYTPSKQKQRSNAHRGGHKFRASLSPKPPSKLPSTPKLHSTPICDMYKENENNTNNMCLASELHRRLEEHSEQGGSTLSSLNKPIPKLHSTPINDNTSIMYHEDQNNSFASELHRRLAEHSEDQEKGQEGSLSRTLF